MNRRAIGRLVALVGLVSFVALASCRAKPTSPERETKQGSADAPASAPSARATSLPTLAKKTVKTIVYPGGADPFEPYRGGTRLKISWARLPLDETVRWPLGFFDAARGRVCTLVALEGQTSVCVPEADETIDDDDVGFLDEARTLPVHVVPDAACGEQAAAPDGRMVALSVIGDTLATQRSTRRESLNRYVREAPRFAQGVFTHSGTGCVVTYDRCAKAVCVRPLRRAILDDLVTLQRERIPGATSDDEQAIRYRGSDGAVLPHARYTDRRPKPGDPPRLDRLVGGAGADTSPAAARLATRVRTLAMGPGIALSLHDTALARDCVPRKAEDGIWRCVVLLPSTCALDEIRGSSGAGGSTNLRVHGPEVLSASGSFCPERDETCCAGGPIFFPAQPYVPARRSGDDPQERPAVPQRAVLFAEVPRRTTGLRRWQPQVEASVYDRVHDLDPDVFARLDVVRDP